MCLQQDMNLLLYLKGVNQMAKIQIYLLYPNTFLENNSAESDEVQMWKN